MYYNLERSQYIRITTFFEKEEALYVYDMCET